jgi:hypothetical protein
MKHLAVTLTTINIPYVLNDLLKIIKKKNYNDLAIDIIIAGDKKTPKTIYKFINSINKLTKSNLIYLDINEQKKLFQKYSKLWKHIPFNSFARRNFADLYAYQNKYEIITRIDDDNYPIDEKFFDYHSKVGTEISANIISSSNKWFNICELLEDKNKLKFYPRGFPYKFRWAKSSIKKSLKKKKIDLLAGLWFGDPDIDAITRINRPINVTRFNKKLGKIFFLNKKTNCPINTQNTSYSRELVPLFFVSPFAGRYDDIYSNYFLRRIMDHLNKNVAYGYPIVFQKRNEHNLWNDLEKELIGNITCEHVNEILAKINFKSNDIFGCGYELINFLLKNIKIEKSYFKKILFGLKIWLDVIKKIDKKK